MKKIGNSQPEKDYSPAMDWWVALSVFFILTFLFVSIPFILWYDLPWSYKLLAVLGLIGMFLYLTDLSFFTRYRLGKEGLIIKSQIRQLLFSYRDMEEIKLGNVWGLFSLGKRKRFALSGRCLSISLRRGIWKVVTISPKEQQEFLDELLKRVDSERSRRATLVSPVAARG